MSSATGGGIGGPLGDLMAASPPSDALPYAPIHVRALETTLGGGDVPPGAWVLPVWADPGEGPALHQALKSRMEATLLQELSRPASSFLQEGRKRFEYIWLVAFSRLANPAEAIRAFGFRPVSFRNEMQPAIAHVRQEAARVDRALPNDVAEVFEAAIARQPAIEPLEDALLEHTGDEVWGERPGKCFERLANATHGFGLPDLDGDWHGLRQLERFAVPPSREVVRWIPPMVFQGMADLIGVLAHRQGLKVDWAMCEPDEHGVAPPALLRLANSSGNAVHLPVGLELLRWCVMPARHGETIPSVADWAADVFRQMQ